LSLHLITLSYSIGLADAKKPAYYDYQSITMELNEKLKALLEKLKEEWELTPKKPFKEEDDYHGVNVYHDAYKKVVSRKKFMGWAHDCGLSDFYGLRDALTILKDEGFITDFSFASDIEPILTLHFPADFEVRYGKTVFEIIVEDQPLVSKETIQINYEDKASREGWTKKWETLQTICNYYASNSRPKEMLIPIPRLTIKGRTRFEIDGILDGLKREGCFAAWHRGSENYEIKGINHKQLTETYQQTETTYEKLAEAYRERIEKEAYREQGITYISPKAIERAKTIEGKFAGINDEWQERKSPIQQEIERRVEEGKREEKLLEKVDQKLRALQIFSENFSEINKLGSQRTKEPLHIVIDEVKKDIGIKGLEEKVLLQKPKNKRIQLRNFPSDLRWEEISIQFLNEHEVIVKARDDTLQATYETMGFQDERRKLPNKQWQFLRLLSLKNGEISWENNQGLPLKQINSIKKQKQLLSEALKAYFQVSSDEPFDDYKKEKAYKIKLTLVPEQGLKDIDEREAYDE